MVSNSIKDESEVLFYVSGVQGYSCNTYEHWTYTLSDKEGNPVCYKINEWLLKEIRIIGYAANLRLEVCLVKNDGTRETICFHTDCSFTGPTPDLHVPKTNEWNNNKPFETILNMIQEVRDYGLEAYMKIKELRVKNYELNREKTLLESDKSILHFLQESADVLSLREGIENVSNITDIRFLKTLILPSTVKSIEIYGICRCDKLKTIVFKSEEVPKISFISLYYTIIDVVYVPLDSLGKYVELLGTQCGFEGAKFIGY